MNNVPHELVAAHLNIDVATLQKMPQSKTRVVPSQAADPERDRARGAVE